MTASRAEWPRSATGAGGIADNVLTWLLAHPATAFAIGVVAVAASVLWVSRHELRGGRPPGVVTRRQRTRQAIFQIAVTAFGLTVPRLDATDTERRRRDSGQYAAQRDRTVTILGWSRSNRAPVAFCVAHPVDVLTGQGARPRETFEQLVRAAVATLPDHEWTFEWPDGAHYVRVRQTETVAADVRAVYDQVAVALDYPRQYQISRVVDVERDQAGQLTAVELPLPKRFPVQQATARLAAHHAINARLTSPQGVWESVWLPKRDRYQLVAAPPLPRMVPFDVDHIRAIADTEGGHRLSLGVTYHGRPVVWDPTNDEREVHGLLAGATGAGKTSLARVVILSAILTGWDVRIADPKQDDDWVWLEQSGVAVAGTLDDIAELIRGVHTLAERRRHARRASARRSRTATSRLRQRPVLLYVDELAQLLVLDTSRSKQAQADNALRADCAYLLGQLAALARTQNVHLLLATQRPTAGVVDGTLKLNLPMRIGLGDMDGIAARIVFGDSPGERGELTEDERFPKGRGVVKPSTGLVDVQTLWLPLERAYRLLPATVEVTDVQRERPRDKASNTAEGQPAAPMRALPAAVDVDDAHDIQDESSVQRPADAINAEDRPLQTSDEAPTTGRGTRSGWG